MTFTLFKKTAHSANASTTMQLLHMMFIFLKTARSDNASTATLYVITLHHADTKKACSLQQHKT